MFFGAAIAEYLMRKKLKKNMFTRRVILYIQENLDFIWEKYLNNLFVVFVHYYANIAKMNSYKIKCMI